MMNESDKNCDDEVLDALIRFLEYLPQDRVKMIDLKRYGKMMKAAADLKAILAETNSEGEININLNELCNLGAIETTIDDFLVMNTRRFSEMIAEADNFEIFPRTDGKLQLNITFQSVLKTIG